MRFCARLCSVKSTVGAPAGTPAVDGSTGSAFAGGSGAATIGTDADAGAATTAVGASMQPLPIVVQPVSCTSSSRSLRAVAHSLAFRRARRKSSSSASCIALAASARRASSRESGIRLCHASARRVRRICSSCTRWSRSRRYSRQSMRCVLGFRRSPIPRRRARCVDWGARRGSWGQHREGDCVQDVRAGVLAGVNHRRFGLTTHD